MSDDLPPEPDRVDGAPHPRETAQLLGHDHAEAAFLSAYGAGRLHHAWMITGARGIGKATLAWRIARFLVATPPEEGLFGGVPDALALPQDHPVWRRSLSLSEPAIALCRRAWDDKAKRLKTALTVDEVRRLKQHFSLSAPDGGWRVALIDAVDEMNNAAANALLKLLEEPPAQTVLLLICHQPARLLPTIRSRCRTLRLSQLGLDDFGTALAQAGQEVEDIRLLHSLTGGSVGDAIRLLNLGGLDVVESITALLSDGGAIDRHRLASLAARGAGRQNATTYTMIVELTLLLIARMARAGAGADLAGDAVASALRERLCPTPDAAWIWAETQQQLTERTTHAAAVNLDPEQVILDMFLTIDKTAARVQHDLR
ncbi:MAG: DNA polymerase III subunit delta' [Pseudomonadota bacterium]